MEQCESLQANKYESFNGVRINGIECDGGSENGTWIRFEFEDGRTINVRSFLDVVPSGITPKINRTIGLYKNYSSPKIQTNVHANNLFATSMSWAKDVNKQFNII